MMRPRRRLRAAAQKGQKMGKRNMRSLAAGPLLVGWALALASAPFAPPAAANNGGGAATCAWPLKTTVDTLNVAFPDASAIYWTTPFTITANLKEIIVGGHYTDARYLSIDAYTNNGSSYSCGGKASGLADFEIGAELRAAPIRSRWRPRRAAPLPSASPARPPTPARRISCHCPTQPASRRRPWARPRAISGSSCFASICRRAVPMP